jgi:hypothetical protein
MIKWFLSLLLLMCCITLTYLCMLNHPCIPVMKQFGHDGWSFWCVVGFSLPLFYWGFLHQCSLRKLSIFLNFAAVFLWSWDKSNIGFIKWVRQISCPFYFVEHFTEGWYSFFFKCLIEFSKQSIRSWTFLFWEILYCCFNFILCYTSIQVINIPLVQFRWS